MSHARRRISARATIGTPRRFHGRRAHRSVEWRRLLGRACEWAAAGALAKAEADLKTAATLTQDTPDAACTAAIDALRAKGKAASKHKK